MGGQFESSKSILQMNSDHHQEVKREKKQTFHRKNHSIDVLLSKTNDRSVSMRDQVLSKIDERLEHSVKHF